MPERATIGVYLANGFTKTVEENYQAIGKKMQDGWILDRTINQSAGVAKPIVTDNAVVYHLIKYSDEELAQETELPAQKRVVDRVKESDAETIRELIQQGWTIIQEWAKETLLYLYEGDSKSPLPETQMEVTQ